MVEEKTFVKYEHHGKMVSVCEDQKGLHRQVCLCYDCSKFNPGMPEKNCHIANLIYAVCIAMDVTTPVWECPNFEQGIPYVSTKVEVKQDAKSIMEQIKSGEADKQIKAIIEQSKDIRTAKCFHSPDVTCVECSPEFQGSGCKPLVEHKPTCNFILASEAGKFVSEVSQCDCK